MLLIRVCQWIKLQIQLITKDPVEVIRAGFRKSDKPSSKIPGMFKGQLYQLPFKLIRSANRPPMLPSSTLRKLVEHRGVEPVLAALRLLGQVRNSRLSSLSFDSLLCSPRLRFAFAYGECPTGAPLQLRASPIQMSRYQLC